MNGITRTASRTPPALDTPQDPANPTGHVPASNSNTQGAAGGSHERIPRRTSSNGQMRPRNSTFPALRQGAAARFPCTSTPAEEPTSDTRPEAAPADTGEAPQQGRMARVGSEFWHGTNVKQWFAAEADDRAYLGEIGGVGVSALERNSGVGHAGTVNNMQREVAKLSGLLAQIRASDPALAKSLESSLKELQKHVKTLSEGVPVGTRLFNAALNFAVNWFPVLPPSPLMKNEPMTFAYTCAAVMNAMGMLGGSSMSIAGSGRPVPFGGGVLGEQSNEAHLYPWIIGAQFLISESVIRGAGDAGNHHLAENTKHFTEQGWWHVLLGLSAFGVLAQPLFSGLIKAGAKKGFKAVAGGRFDNPQLQAETVARIGEAVKGEFKTSLGRLLSEVDVLKMVRQGYTTGKLNEPAITRAMNTLVTMIADEASTLQARAQARLGPIDIIPTVASRGAITASPAADVGNVGPAATTDEAGPRVGTPASRSDRPERLGYALVGALFATYTIIAVQPEEIATIDLSADAAVLILAMMALVFSNTATAKDSKDRLLNMASTTIAGAFAFTGDLVTKRAFPEQFPHGLMSKNPYAAAVLMQTMVALLPEHITNGVISTGTAIGSGVGKAAGWIVGKGVARSGEEPPAPVELPRTELQARSMRSQPSIELQDFHEQNHANFISQANAPISDFTQFASDVGSYLGRAFDLYRPAAPAERMLQPGRVLGEVDDDVPARVVDDVSRPSALTLQSPPPFGEPSHL